MVTFNVTKEEAGQRLDKFVRKNFKNAPLSALYRVFRVKDVKLNGKRTASGETILNENDEVIVYLSTEFLTEKEPLVKSLPQSFAVVYEDENIIIVDKPAGLSLHQDEKEKTNTLANQVALYCRKKNETASPVHRLDRNTSGLVIFGKNMRSLRILNEAFKTRKGIEKYYLALCFNKLTTEKDIAVPLMKNEKLKLSLVDPNGLPAETIVRPLQYNDEFTLVEAELKTGRTHQIRAHLAYAGYPIVADKKYGDFAKNKAFEKKYGQQRQFLRAYRVKFTRLEGVLSYLSGKEFVVDWASKKGEIVKNIFPKNADML